VSHVHVTSVLAEVQRGTTHSGQRVTATSTWTLYNAIREGTCPFPYVRYGGAVADGAWVCAPRSEPRRLFMGQLYEPYSRVISGKGEHFDPRWGHGTEPISPKPR
jgi:hypothetical protein